MKKAISILLSATITLSLFTGCQQTPANERKDRSCAILGVSLLYIGYLFGQGYTV